MALPNRLRRSALNLRRSPNNSRAASRRNGRSRKSKRTCSFCWMNSIANGGRTRSGCDRQIWRSQRTRMKMKMMTRMTKSRFCLAVCVLHGITEPFGWSIYLMNTLNYREWVFVR